MVTLFKRRHWQASLKESPEDPSPAKKACSSCLLSLNGALPSTTSIRHAPHAPERHPNGMVSCPYNSNSRSVKAEPAGSSTSMFFGRSISFRIHKINSLMWMYWCPGSLQARSLQQLDMAAEFPVCPAGAKHQQGDLIKR